MGRGEGGEGEGGGIVFTYTNDIKQDYYSGYDCKTKHSIIEANR